MWEPISLWEYLKDDFQGGYRWKKEDRDFAKCYVCYHGDKEIGLIPIEYDDTDLEWANWWKSAYERHNNKLTIRDLMKEIEQRYQKKISKINS